MFVAAHGLSLVVASGDHSSLWCSAFSCCWAQALGTWASVVVNQGLSCSKACGSSETRGWNRVPCTGRQMLNHWTTREVPINCNLNLFFLLTFAWDYTTEVSESGFKPVTVRIQKPWLWSSVSEDSLLLLFLWKLWMSARIDGYKVNDHFVTKLCLAYVY